jgi:hypothetical protein
MGTALAVTVLSMVVTSFGAFSLSTDETILKLTSWGVYHSRYDDVDTGDRFGQALYVGLRKYVVMTCTDAPDAHFQDWRGCSQKVRPCALLVFGCGTLRLTFGLNSSGLPVGNGAGGV